MVYRASVPSCGCIYISLPIFASVTAVAGENLAHILLNQSAAIAVDSETWQAVLKWVLLIHYLPCPSDTHTHINTHRVGYSVLHVYEFDSVCAQALCFRVCLLIWIPWSTFNPYFPCIWSLMRLRFSVQREKKMLSSMTATQGLVYQHHY